MTTTTTTFTSISCYKCGVVFGMADYVYTERLRNGGDFYCTNGHSAVFKETEASRFERLWKAERERAALLRSEKDQVEASLSATKGVVTRMRKRAIAGACQFCHRNFTNMARHMAVKHPDEQP